MQPLSEALGTTPATDDDLGPLRELYRELVRGAEHECVSMVDGKPVSSVQRTGILDQPENFGLVPVPTMPPCLHKTTRDKLSEAYRKGLAGGALSDDERDEQLPEYADWLQGVTLAESSNASRIIALVGAMSVVSRALKVVTDRRRAAVLTEDGQRLTRLLAEHGVRLARVPKNRHDAFRFAAVSSKDYGAMPREWRVPL